MPAPDDAITVESAGEAEGRLLNEAIALRSQIDHGCEGFQVGR
jgi:hypothetical protein